ncbi:hypothetical protein P8H26_04620 [Pseudochrobactrum sp. sp1633]|uniref:hypothetical protein n=1 Tax=Pseudochrobactrum sp. sp1633 TaxID=3036706 RepID=UPI0025A5EA83|nr:hypothetical protein [Pseudochrobactrum sp. sp1633]MDM8344670.1 hypothetical protein [Pseudochrobactrum sp. sp1633]HWD13570.1 hypothetical protein [Pseudochrobactrum sp.]
MVLYFYFKALYSYVLRRKTTVLTACLVALSTPAIAQNISDNRLCRAYEEDLQAVDDHTRLSPRQTARYQQLAHMQQQAKSDAKRYSCLAGAFSSGSNSVQCRYINSSLVRIDTAMRILSTQAATPQQRRVRQIIYTDMRRYNCRTPQSLDRLMKENRAVVAGRKRIQQAYKKPKPVRQAALPQAILIQQDVAETMQTPVVPVKVSANARVGKSVFSIPAVPAIQHTKAAESAPPPVSKAVDYVPDPGVRRVGPAYLPAQ